jgi:hypothetical protein
MNTGNFDRPVTICLPDSIRFLTIASASEAASVLADKWPITYGRSYQRALAMCAAVAEGQTTSEKARSAFIAAAMEAGVRTEIQASPAIIISPDKVLGVKPTVPSRLEQSEWPVHARGTRAPRPTF